MISGLLSLIALALVPVLAVVSYPRLGRAAIPLTLLAIMAATGSMFEFNDWITEALILPEHLGRPLGVYNAVLEHPLWPFWQWDAPGVLAIVAILWTILRIRRLPS